MFFIRSLLICIPVLLVMMASAQRVAGKSIPGDRSYAAAVRERDLEEQQDQPDGRLSVSANSDMSVIAIRKNQSTIVKVWDVHSSKIIQTFKHKRWVLDAQLSPDGKTLVTTSLEREAIVWDIASGQPKFTFQFSTFRGKIDWIGDDGKVEAKGQTLDNSNHRISFTADGKFVDITSGNGNIKQWNIETGKETLFIVHDGEDSGWRVCSSPDSKFVLLCSGATNYDNAYNSWDFWGPARLTLFSWKTYKQQWCVFDLHKKNPADAGAYFVSDGTEIATASISDSNIEIRDSSNGKLLAKLPGLSEDPKNDIYSMTASSDGKVLASGDSEHIYVWNVATRQKVRTMPYFCVESLALSSDGQLLASTGCGERKHNHSVPSSTVVIWDTHTGKWVKTIKW